MFTHLTLYLIACIVFVHCYLFKSRTLKSLFNFPPRYSMHACLYNFTYAEVGEVVTPGLAAKTSYRWPLRNHFLIKIVGQSSVVLAWVAPHTVNLCFYHHSTAIFPSRCTVKCQNLLHPATGYLAPLHKAAVNYHAPVPPSLTHHLNTIL